MDDKDKKSIEVLPDFLEGHDQETVQKWREWKEAGDVIDNHPDRYQIIMNPKTGNTKTFDCKTPYGVLRKSMNNFGADPNEIERCVKIATELQVLKTRKGHLNKLWGKAVYGKRQGDKTILGIRSAEIIEMFGKYYTLEEVKQVVHKEWGLAVKIESISKFYHDNFEKIEIKRADYVLKGKETRLATDAGRMEVLGKLAWEMEQKFDKGKSIEASKELRAIVEQIRKEVKGDEIKLTIDGRIDIQATIQANQAVHDALQKLPINMLVIGLTAAKRGINPASLMASLATSYYSKLNGFNKLGKKEDIQLPGQYIRQYDWNDIQKRNEEIKIEDAEIIETSEVVLEEVKRVEVLDKKQKMLDLLKSWKNQVSNGIREENIEESES